VEPLSLINAIYDNDVCAVEMAIAAGADVNAWQAGGHHPPLHVAIEHQRVEIVRRLIAAGALLNWELSMPGWDFGGPGWTPLAHAIDIESDAAWQAYHERGHESTVLTELLLASGAAPTNRAFEIANNYGNEKALELLRRYAGRG
jgi:ankyrin repeat protein